MAERKLSELLMEVEAAHPETRVVVQHRLGELELGEVAVAIAVASPHRKASFSACALLIDRLKEDVPIFKKSTARAEISGWVSVPDYGLSCGLTAA